MDIRHGHAFIPKDLKHCLQKLPHHSSAEQVPSLLWGSPSNCYCLGISRECRIQDGGQTRNQITIENFSKIGNEAFAENKTGGGKLVMKEWS